MNRFLRVLRDSEDISMNKTTLKALLLLCLAVCALAGWERTYGTINYEAGRAVKETSDGGFVVVGSYSLGPGPTYDVYVIKTDGNGNLLWSRTYGGSEEDAAFDLVLTDSDEIVIAATTRSFTPSEGSHPYVLKLNDRGDTLWSRMYDSPCGESSNSIDETFDGGYIIAGHRGCGPDQDSYLMKINSFGDTLWTNTYDGGLILDELYSVTKTPDGGYIACGMSDNGSPWLYCPYAMKADSLGEFEWERIWGEYLGGSEFRSVIRASDGGYILCGTGVLIAKIDELGDTVWTRYYGGSYCEIGYCVAPTFDGGYIICGVSLAYDTGNVLLIKTNAIGDTIWTRILGGPRGDCGYCVAQTSDSGYIIAGYTYSFGAGDGDVYLIKTDSLGYTGIEENPPAARPGNIALSAYPNPFNSSMRFAIDAPSVEKQKFASLRIEIFDISGRKVDEISADNPVDTIFKRKR